MKSSEPPSLHRVQPKPAMPSGVLPGMSLLLIHSAVQFSRKGGIAWAPLTQGALFCSVKHPLVLLALKPSMGLAGRPLLPPFTLKVSIHRKESQTLENNFREILFLIEQIDALKALLRETRDGLHNHSWNADGDPAEGWNHTEIIDEVSEPGTEAGACPLSESGQLT